MQTGSRAQSIQPKWNDDSERVEADYYEKKFKRIQAEWHHFVHGGTKIDISVIPNEILESWRRCRSLQIDPHALTRPPVLNEGDIELLLQKNSQLIDASRLFINHLYHFVRSSRFTVTLFDRDGYILNVMQEKKYEEASRVLTWVVGSRWTEDIVGNNAAGTALYYKRPIRIFATQHYCRAYQKHSASSAPVFGPDGEMMGGIAVIGFYYSAHPHTLGMVVAAARAVENELKIRRALAQADKTSKDQNNVISSMPEAIINLDEKGRILFINDNARRMLRIGLPKVEGEHLRDLLGAANYRFFQIVESSDKVVDREVRIFTANGSGDYILTCSPTQDRAGSTTGKILFLNEIKRARTLVAKMIGAKAKFHFEDIYGQNPRFLKTIEQARMIAQSNSNVLLLGKSGTGKDIFAQAIHNAGDRWEGPYVAINCAAIPRDLIASEVFGYADGAFTGSRKGGNQGKFELADSGTIFLDEIAEMPLELQSVLLRVIEEKSVMRIGDTRVRPVDVRIIAATNKDLKEEIRKGAFREDLYYRLNVFSIDLMPLCERRDDIQLLATRFVKKYEIALKKRIDRISDDVLTAFMRYSWPGNIRELQNIVERMMNMARGNELTVELLPREILDVKVDESRSETIESCFAEEKKVIASMLKMKVRKKDIAQKMNISRMTLYRKIEKYGLT